ncbi:MAG: hypothetical protein OYH77_01180 [Pseudomonadota bacterium]|nr:hypothetical protein [Pseudomonadota bacterium]
MPVIRWSVIIFLLGACSAHHRTDRLSTIAASKQQSTANVGASVGAKGDAPVISLKSKRKRTSASILLGYLAKGAIPDTYHQKLQARARPPKPHSVDEAVVAIALVEQAISSAVALEELALRMHFDIIQAFKSNPYLQHSLVLPRVATALRKRPTVQTSDNVSGNDGSFTQQLVAIVAARIENLRADLEQVEILLTMPVSPQQSAESFEELSSDLFRSGDYIVMEADYLANHGEYQDALKRLELLDQSSPLHQVAHEKRTEISNKAVHDLRKKAAIAYQKAGTISDMRTRIAYLQEASNHLRHAINRYPNAETLATVKSNLATISAALQKLRSMASAEQ